MKSQVITKLLECGVIAVIRASSLEEAKKLSEACAEGGIVGLEVTFTVPGAEEVIASLSKVQNAPYIVGAGTVLDETTARLAILKGAQFIVSPSFDKGVAELCNLYQIPYLAGCFTITEIIAAMKAGAAARYGHTRETSQKVAAEGVEALKELTGSVDAVLTPSGFRRLR